MKSFFLFLTAIFTLILVGCGGGGGGSTPEKVFNPDPAVIDPGTPADPDAPATVSALQLSASTTAINTGGTVQLTLSLFDASGQVVSSSKQVILELDQPALGSISSPVTVTGGTRSGIAFTARNSEGSVTITATVDGKSDSETIQISDSTSADSITLVPNPALISLGGTSVVSATVLDANNEEMPDGTMVNFTVNNTAIGTIVASAATMDGIATVTFAAGSTNAGTVTVTATSGSASGSTEIEVTGTEAGSIQFDSATPQIISIKGAGGIETSNIKFQVIDENGLPIAGSHTVRLTLSGPGGGEYIDDNDDSPGTIDVGTKEGVVSVFLHSGTIPGPATITATVLDSQGDPTDHSTSSGVIAIGGGIPSAGHFSLSAETLNIEGGLNIDGLENSITALLADRYGDYNVLEGTTVSFYSECGAIDRAVALNNVGAGTVIFRTQTPRPHDVDPDPWATAQTWQANTAYSAGAYILPITPNGKMYQASAGGISGGVEPNWPATTDATVADGGLQWRCKGDFAGSCGSSCDLENAVISSFLTYLDHDITTGSANPRDGICTIIAVVDGEEEFTDANGNGLYDADIDSFQDTYDDIHIDMDDDPLNLITIFPGKPFDSAFEDLVVDRNKLGGFDGLNGIWDANKRLAGKMNILITGQEYFLTTSTDNQVFSIPHNGQTTIYFALHDINYNRPVDGTKISISASGAKLQGKGSYTYLDSNYPGTPILSAVLLDPDTTKDEDGAVVVKFSWGGEEVTIYGTSR